MVTRRERKLGENTRDEEIGEQTGERRPFRAPNSRRMCLKGQERSRGFVVSPASPKKKEEKEEVKILDEAISSSRTARQMSTVVSRILTGRERRRHPFERVSATISMHKDDKSIYVEGPCALIGRFAREMEGEAS